MTSCGTQPGPLSARQDRNRPEGDVMDKQNILVFSLMPQPAEMLYLLSGSSLHSRFLWPQNCTCRLIIDPGGKKTNIRSNNKMHEQRGRAKDSYKQSTGCFQCRHSGSCIEHVDSLHVAEASVLVTPVSVCCVKGENSNHHTVCPQKNTAICGGEVESDPTCGKMHPDVSLRH